MSEFYQPGLDVGLQTSGYLPHGLISPARARAFVEPTVFYVSSSCNVFYTTPVLSTDMETTGINHIIYPKEQSFRRTALLEGGFIPDGLVCKIFTFFFFFKFCLCSSRQWK